ncbi:MAG: hydrolase [Alphaproteobacteria bacterium]
MLLKKRDSFVLIIDIQERLAPVMKDPRKVINGATMILKAAQYLEVPAIVTEQYPRGLGPSIVDVRDVMPEGSPFEKIDFSCAKDEAVIAQIKSLKKRQVVLAGIEAHVCVLQTAFDLKKLGYEVFVVAEACSSRKEEDYALAINRMRRAGIEIVSIEMVLFEWLEKAGTEEFKQISKGLVGR